MMSDEEKRIFEKAKSALIRLGKYSDDKENRDTTRINDGLLEGLLTGAFIGMGNVFGKVNSYSIEDKDIRRLYQINLLRKNFDYDIDKKREVLSRVFPTLQENGIIDTNELALSMMEEVYNIQRKLEIIQWEQDKFKGIERMQPMSSEQWTFLSGVWKQHASEYVIAKSVLVASNKVIVSLLFLRKFISLNGQIFERLTNVEYKLLEHDKKFDKVFDQLQNERNIVLFGCFNKRFR